MISQKNMSIKTLTVEQLYSEVADLARDQGIASKELWDELIDDVVEDHLDLGEIDLEEDSEGLKDDLRARWTAYKTETLADSEDAELEKEEVSVVLKDNDDIYKDDDEDEV